MTIRVVNGDLLEQDVEVLVNPWNRNLIPWWLLWPHGVSGALKRRAGFAPFQELAHHGLLPLGGAVATSAGNLPHRAIIHVAGLNLRWCTSEPTIQACVRNAVALARGRGFASLAFPLIGAGVGGLAPERVLAVMQAELAQLDFPGEVRLVRHAPRP